MSRRSSPSSGLQTANISVTNIKLCKGPPHINWLVCSSLPYGTCGTVYKPQSQSGQTHGEQLIFACRLVVFKPAFDEAVRQILTSIYTNIPGTLSVLIRSLPAWIWFLPPSSCRRFIFQVGIDLQSQQQLSVMIMEAFIQVQKLG